MKKSILVLLTGMTLITSQACRKSQVTTTDVVQNETIDATVNSGDSYRYSLSSGESDNSYDLVSSSASGATVVIENTGNETAMVYSPAPSYTGTDVITISNAETEPAGHHHHGKHHHGKKHSNQQGGGCHSDGGKATRQITFNITVNSPQN